jgi:hypothetical protein
MKHEKLRVIASSLNIIAWAILVSGTVGFVIVAVGAATYMAKFGFFLGGVLFISMISLILMSLSKYILLSLDNNNKMEEIMNYIKEKK